MKISLVAFDFDGTIVDSNEAKGKCFGLVFERFGPNISRLAMEHHRSNLGQNRLAKIRAISELAELNLSGGEILALCDEFSRIVISEVSRCSLIPGFKGFVERVGRRLPYFVISATPQEELDLLVRRFGLRDLFEEVAGFPEGKVEFLIRIASTWRCPISDVLLVGDSDSDERSAVTAGSQFFRIDADSEVSFASLAELLGSNCQDVL